MSDLAIVREYEQALRAGLAGLPRPDVDDIVEEMRSHLREQTAEGRSPAEAAAAYGDPAAVAAEILERRLTAEDGSRLPEAPRSARVCAFVADFVVGWGPLVVFPVWMPLIGWVQDRFMMSPAMIADLQERFGYARTTVPLWMLAVTAVLVAWGVFYQRTLRARSASVGMRMAGLSRLRLHDDHIVLRTSDVAESEPSRIVARSKWYLAVPMTLLVPLVALAALYYTAMAVGSFTQPTQATLEAADGYEDFTRSDDVCAAFYDAVRAGDLGRARAMAEPRLAADVTALVERARTKRMTSAEPGMNVGDTSYEWHEYYGGGEKPRTVVLTLSKREEEREPGVYATVYRISTIEEAPSP